MFNKRRLGKYIVRFCHVGKLVFAPTPKPNCETDARKDTIFENYGDTSLPHYNLASFGLFAFCTVKPIERPSVT